MIKLYRNWVALNNQAETLHDIQDRDLDLPLACSEVEASTNGVTDSREQSLFRYEEDCSVSMNVGLLIPYMSTSIMMPYNFVFKNNLTFEAI